MQPVWGDEFEAPGVSHTYQTEAPIKHILHTQTSKMEKYVVYARHAYREL